MNTQNILTQLPNEILARHRALTGILEHAVASLELTPEQRSSIEARYREVGNYLAEALKFKLTDVDIFPQGSYRLGTVIRPWRDITEVFDLDIVFRLILPAAGQNPALFRAAVGDHLRRKYPTLLQPLAKGWRLDYSKERDYYLDIIPAMDSDSAGILSITDDVRWLLTNPRGFGDWVAEIAKISPQFTMVVLANEATFSNRQASVEPLPTYSEFKSALQRIVQIAKRYRDYYFNKKLKVPKHAPASIMITTLLAHAYKQCARTRAFESGYDLLLECVKRMPSFVEVRRDSSGKSTYSLRNPSLETENLVSKWNDDPELAKAFFGWCHDFVSFLELLPSDNAPQRTMLEETLGRSPVAAAYKQQMQALTVDKDSRVLRVSSRLGLTTSLAGIIVPNRKIDGIR